MLSRLSQAAFAGFTLAALGLLVRPAAAQTTYTFNGHVYFLTQTAENWTSAEAEAVTKGGHLVAVNSSAENTFLTTTFTGANVPLWMGGTDIGSVTHTFSWTSGDPFSYTNWYPGEPNNGGGDEDYVTLGWIAAVGYNPDRSAWNDVPLNGTTGYGGTSNGPYFGIIEVPAPEPSAFAVLLVGALGLGALTVRARKRPVSL